MAAVAVVPTIAPLVKFAPVWDIPEFTKAWFNASSIGIKIRPTTAPSAAPLKIDVPPRIAAYVAVSATAWPAPRVNALLPAIVNILAPAPPAPPAVAATAYLLSTPACPINCATPNPIKTPAPAPTPTTPASPANPPALTLCNLSA